MPIQVIANACICNSMYMHTKTFECYLHRMRLCQRHGRAAVNGTSPATSNPLSPQSNPPPPSLQLKGLPVNLTAPPARFTALLANCNLSSSFWPVVMLMRQTDRRRHPRWSTWMCPHAQYCLIWLWRERVPAGNLREVYGSWTLVRSRLTTSHHKACSGVTSICHISSSCLHPLYYAHWCPAACMEGQLGIADKVNSSCMAPPDKCNTVTVMPTPST